MYQRSSVPSEIRLQDQGKRLQLTFEEGQYQLSAEYLRVHSPSAEVQGHAPDERKTVGGKRDCSIKQILPVGNYAIRLVFSDGHDTGLYHWSYLAELGRDQAQKWATYLAELDQKQLSRDQQGEK